MPVLSLARLAQRSCIRNIQAINDVGDIPYSILRPVLIKLENPEQLRNLEKVSPQLVGVDAELWKALIKRDIPNWEEKIPEVKNPANWFKVYRRLGIESQREIDEDTEMLEAAMKDIQQEKAKHTSIVVDPKTVPKLPRMGGMRVEKNKNKIYSRSGGSSSTLSFAAGSRTKTLTSKGLLDKVRREVNERKLFSSRNSLLARPTHELGAKATRIRNPPRALVEEHMRPPASPTSPSGPISKLTSTVYAPKRRTVVPNTSTTLGTSDRTKSRGLATLPTTDPAHISSKQEPHETVSSSATSKNPSLPSISAIHSSSSQQRPSPDGRPRIKRPVNPFMPVKKRRIP